MKLSASAMLKDSINSTQDGEVVALTLALAVNQFAAQLGFAAPQP